MANKTENQKAWLFVLPVVLLVAFNALIPLMTVVNYSVQETFGDNVFFWEGVKWFEQVLPNLGPHQPDKLQEYPEYSSRHEINANWKIIAEKFNKNLFKPMVFDEKDLKSLTLGSKPDPVKTKI